MSFEDEVRDGLWRSAPMMVRSVRRSSGRRGPTVERPNRDDADTQDLGRKVRTFNVDCFVLTIDGFGARDHLIAALEKEGPGTFVDPFGGLTSERWVKVADYDVSNSFAAEGIANFSIVFEEVGENAERGFTPGRVSNVYQIGVQSSALSSAASAAFVNSYITDGMPGFVREAGADVIGSLTDQVGGQLFTAIGVDASMSDAIDGIGAVGLTALTGGGVDIASGISSGFALLSSSVPNAAEGVNGFLTLSSFEAAGVDVPVLTATRQVEAANRTALGALIRRTAISAAAELLPNYTFVSYDQAAEITGQFLDVIDREMDRAGGNVAGESDAGVFSALASVRTSVVDYTREAGAGKARTISDMPWLTEASVVTAHRLYGDARRASEIVTRNGIAHPNMVPSWSPIEVLDG
ncbi:MULTISPECIES: DNA circularization N-terminal domain-containing protein [Thalassospira]|uniref:DNA circularization N-terminal domain-containing protein n=1 Tax=Thalassospira TaxID=168934 RepID=UPI00081009C2|nr:MULTISPECIES: DNA circularization N-terminal domain-containing protein [Thalassospira]OCK08666.1 DNA circulation family protein [Thalassospira sp. KO164]SEE54659.1 Mu-like prophage DNA circulation protein [Thalassospira permensis]